MLANIRRSIKRRFPQMVPVIKAGRGNIRAFYFNVFAASKERYVCPVCNYAGPFINHSSRKGRYAIKATQCPKCELFERHRLQYLVLQDLFLKRDFSNCSILHFAPEPRLERLFKKTFDTHHTTDIDEAGVDYIADVCALPFNNGSYDVVFASHVLEHVKDDEKALSEIRRILKPAGIAILPVPIVSNITIDYPSPNIKEFGHVRACGTDYFDRYRRYFSHVEVYNSSGFNESFQLYTMEDRSFYPTEESPMRTPMLGQKHMDYVPVCYV